MTTKDRLKEFLSYKKIGRNKFETKLGIASGYMSSKGVTITSEVIEKASAEFPDLNLDWLITGNGPMLKEAPTAVVVRDEPEKGAIPYYNDLPVSAGERGLAGIPSNEKPSGWIRVPGVIAELGAFPVIGCSMEPYIHAGDFIAVSAVNNWERVDPDKTYLIITTDERMIKHLMIDNEDTEILWCISPNYPKFKIYKAEIQFIYRITFHGKIM